MSDPGSINSAHEAGESGPVVLEPRSRQGEPECPGSPSEVGATAAFC